MRGAKSKGRIRGGFLIWLERGLCEGRRAPAAASWQTQTWFRYFGRLHNMKLPRLVFDTAALRHIPNKFATNS
jgi:hypothetical protein